jgi:hypothetical protein
MFFGIWKYWKIVNTYKKLGTQANHHPFIFIDHIDTIW